MVINLTENNSIILHYLTQIRDKEIQKDSLRFRKNLFRVAQIMAYEISKTLVYIDKKIETPLTSHVSKVIENPPIIGSILRAGLALHEGFIDFFDESESAFVSAYRKHSTPEDFEVIVEYMASPNLDNRTFIIVDPMLATGKSLYLAYKAFCKHGTPSKVIFTCLIASKQGIEYIQKLIPEAIIYVADIDNELNENSYIVPGLGDAGDLAFGIKL